MYKNKAFSYLGLAVRAGKAVSGQFCVERSIRQGRAKLVIVSEDASENSRKSFHDICTYHKVPLYIFGNSEELGRAMGKEFRISAAIEDEGLAKAAAKELDQESGIGGSKYAE